MLLPDADRGGVILVRSKEILGEAKSPSDADRRIAAAGLPIQAEASDPAQAMTVREGQLLHSLISVTKNNRTRVSGQATRIDRSEEVDALKRDRKAREDADSDRATRGGENSGKVRRAAADKKWRNRARKIASETQEAAPSLSAKMIARKIHNAFEAEAIRQIEEEEGRVVVDDERLSPVALDTIERFIPQLIEEGILQPPPDIKRTGPRRAR